MKFGFRKPSLKKRIAARTSWKRYARHNLGIKAPRGAGFFTNPKKAIYNKVYNQVTIDPFKPRKGRSRNSSTESGDGAFGCGCLIIIVIVVLIVIFV